MKSIKIDDWKESNGTMYAKVQGKWFEVKEDGTLKDKNYYKNKAMMNFSTVRKEAQDWVSGMGGAVTDKDVSKRIGKASKKDVKGFVGDMKKSLLWKWY